MGVRRMTEGKIFLVKLKGTDAENDTTIDYIEDSYGECAELTPELKEKIRNEVKEYIIAIEDTHQLNFEQEFVKYAKLRRFIIEPLKKIFKIDIFQKTLKL